MLSNSRGRRRGVKIMITSVIFVLVKRSHTEPIMTDDRACRVTLCNRKKGLHTKSWCSNEQISMQRLVQHWLASATKIGVRVMSGVLYGQVHTVMVRDGAFAL